MKAIKQPSYIMRQTTEASKEKNLGSPDGFRVQLFWRINRECEQERCKQDSRHNGQKSGVLVRPERHNAEQKRGHPQADQ